MGVDLNYVEREHESSQMKLTIEDLLIKTHILTHRLRRRRRTVDIKRKVFFYNYSITYRI
ncbi:hypothetical protein IGI04_007162 [Brassica rapa subsp. trilocularis]|uniref:Uncharacterized protein n=1 Tax=Brassica rapa subsp. trilocularis TaxID=1813537 RepID=A0ABQ7NIY7_BRACM|nr:hypothetical protein IGI04_007162 [Brassica rapa subsp. trilocularis]